MHWLWINAKKDSSGKFESISSEEFTFLIGVEIIQFLIVIVVVINAYVSESDVLLFCFTKSKFYFHIHFCTLNCKQYINDYFFRSHVL